MLCLRASKNSDDCNSYYKVYYLQALGSQENLANGVGQEAGGSRRPSNDSGGSGKGLNVDAEPFNRPLSKMGNHTPARSSFENVQGAAIR